MIVRILIAVALLVTLASCLQGGDCESPDFRDRIAEFDASVAARFADQYFTLFRTPIDSCEAKSRRAAYIEFFFEGYRAPRAGIWGDSSADLRAMQAGLLAGQDYRRSNPNSVLETYASFGYSAISMEGVWSTRFEHSAFVPTEGYKGEKLWFEPLPELAAKLPADIMPKQQSLHVRIKGYVSRPGHFGHMGMYDRLLYAEDLTVVDDAQHDGSPRRRGAR